MNSLERRINDIYENEKSQNLYDFKLFGINYFRFFRFNLRISVLKREGLYSNKSKQDSVAIKTLTIFFRRLVFQFFDLFCAVFKTKSDFFFFGFPRLTKYRDIHIDKFIEPIVKGANLEDKSLVFQRRLGTEIFSERDPKLSVVGIDFLEIFLRIFAVFLSLFLLPLFFRLNRFRNAVYNVYGIRISLVSVLYGLSFNFIQIIFYRIFFLINKPKSVVVVSREIWFPIICASRLNGIMVFELQHGVTKVITPYYWGEYDRFFDPDIFLSFSDEKDASLFGLDTVSRLHKIGNGWLDYCSKLTHTMTDNSVLIISSTEFSERIFQFIKIAALRFPDFKFFLRLHPQEEWTNEMIDVVTLSDNVCFDNSLLDSSIAVRNYEFILGVKSTVLYEALVLKCKVGFLRFPDFNMDINFSNEKQLEVYKIINFESLDSFLNNKISWPFLQMDFDFSISEVSKILNLDKI